MRHNIITHSTAAMLFGLAHNESSDSFLLGSVPDSSPVHGDSPDEVLRRRHGDKEVRILQFFFFKCTRCAYGRIVWSGFSLQKILEEQRRLKREQEEADTASRRHTGIVPTHHQFITNERFGDLLNITDNTEKRKSGVEVRYRAMCYP